MSNFATVSLTVQIIAFIAFAVAAAWRDENTDWLVGLLVVTAMMMTATIEAWMGAIHHTDPRILDIADILLSGVDSYITAWVGFRLMGGQGVLGGHSFHIKASLVVNLLTQITVYLAHGHDDSFWVYAAGDSGGCLLAGGVLSIGFAKRFATSKASAALLQLPVLVWSLSDLLYWVPDSYPVLKHAGQVGMIVGFAGTALVAVVMASRQPPTLSASPIATA